MTTAPAKPRTKRAGVPAVDTDPAPTSSVVDALAAPHSAALVQPLPLAVLHPHPSNPRRDLGDLTELADSIRAHGIRQNLLVVRDPDHTGEWRIVIGHRRAAAAALVDPTDTVPCAIDNDLDEAGQLELMLLENLQRADLSAVEEADGYQGLLDLGVDVKAIADRTGRAVSTVRSRLRLAGLPECARQAVHEHRATLEDAAALTEFDDDPEAQAALASELGTANFTHRLETARRKAARRARIAPLLAMLAEVGATELDGTTTTAGRDTVLSFDPTYQAGDGRGPHWASPDRAAEILQGASAEWVWTINGGSGDLYVYGPARTDEDRPEPAEPRWVVAQRERDAALAAGRAKWAEHTDVTTTTRRDFICGLLARQHFTQAEVRSLVAFAGYELLAAGWDGDDTTVIGAADAVPVWLNVDTDGVGTRAEADDLDPDDAIEDAIRAALVGLNPHPRLLTALAAANEHIDWQRWATPDRALRAWYLLLEELGYPVSDAERTALAGTAEGSASS